MSKKSPNGTRYCSHCGFSNCPGARGGLCPRWPAAAPLDLVPPDTLVLIEYDGPVTDNE